MNSFTLLMWSCNWKSEQTSHKLVSSLEVCSFDSKMAKLTMEWSKAKWMLERNLSSLIPFLPRFPPLKARVFWRSLFQQGQFYLIWILPAFSPSSVVTSDLLPVLRSEELNKPPLSKQNVNLTLSNEYLRILIDVWINNYAVTHRY